LQDEEASTQMTKALLAFLLLLVARSASAQALQPGETGAPDLTSGIQSPLPPAIRSQLEQALQSRDYPRAEAVLAEEIGRDAKRPDLLKLLGHIFFLDGRYLNCAVAMKKADKLGGLDEAGRFLLAMSYVRLGRRDWSRPELLKLEQSHPEKALYPYWTGRLEYLDQRFQAAVVRYRQALKLDPRFVRGWDNLGLAYEALGQQQDALHAYQEANRLNRESPSKSAWPSLNLGSLMLKLDQLSEGETYLRESLTYDPKSAKARYQLAVLLEKQGKLEDAIAQLKQSVASDPAYAEPHYALNRIYRKQGQLQNAQAALEDFQKLKKGKATESQLAP
jgi:tetratricopeptide (TPR) repeat protein